MLNVNSAVFLPVPSQKSNKIQYIKLKHLPFVVLQIAKVLIRLHFIAFLGNVFLCKIPFYVYKLYVTYTPGLRVICGMSLLLVLVLAPGGFPPGTPRFSPLLIKKQYF